MASLEELRRKLRQRLSGRREDTFLPAQTAAPAPEPTVSVPPPVVEQGFLSPLPQAGPAAEFDSFLPPVVGRAEAVALPVMPELAEITTLRGPAACRRARADEFCDWGGAVAVSLTTNWPCHPAFFGDGRLERVIFLDLETCGLADCPLFLVGLACCEKGELRLELLLARRPAEEAAVIAEAAARLAEAEAVVTFNGAKFDLPFLHQRARHHGVKLRTPRTHLDLYPLAKERFGKRYGDCRLQTLEQRVCGRRRSTEEIASARIPGVYDRFCRSGDGELMRPILYHNAIDLITLADLLARLADDGPVR